jgi:hypothetical protein
MTGLMLLSWELGLMKVSSHRSGFILERAGYYESEFSFLYAMKKVLIRSCAYASAMF